MPQTTLGQMAPLAGQRPSFPYHLSNSQDPGREITATGTYVAWGPQSLPALPEVLNGERLGTAKPKTLGTPRKRNGPVAKLWKKPHHPHQPQQFLGL